MREFHRAEINLAAIVESAEQPTLRDLAAELPVGHELRARFIVVASRDGGPRMGHGAATLREAVRLLFSLVEPNAHYFLNLKVADLDAAWEEVDRYVAAPGARHDA